MLLVLPFLALMLVAAEEPPARIAPPPVVSNVPTWNIALPEAIRIGLQNSPVVRVTFPAPGPVTMPAGREASAANLAIARADPDASECEFQAAIMAHVRSVEQQYWALSSQQTAVWIREATFKLAEEAVRREKEAPAGRAPLGDLAAAERSVEALKAALESDRTDRATIERQFRTILGLPVGDQRRMVAITPPVLVPPSQPQWDAALAEMIVKNPDIEAARRALASAPANAPAEVQKERYNQVVQASTRTLARFFTAIEAEYNHLKTAQRLTIAAQQRLAAQRAFFDEGRITIDRLLAAIAQYASAVSQEGLHASTYNTALAAFEEARGTILPYEGIQIVTPPGRPDDRGKAAAQAEKVAESAR